MLARRIIGRKRFAAGADLAEIQITFNVLEEVLWHRILMSIPPASYGEALGLIGTVLGAGKDMVGRTYVALASKSKVPTLNLEQLFDGTDAP
jgi:hypothetical protein